LDYILHLRLYFQFLLSPIFLWGYMLASGRVNSQLFVAYIAFHLFGYAGGTALNSYYDRDEGPIGGLLNPPPVPGQLLAFSLLWQALGFLLALTLNIQFAVIYAIMFWMSVAYSHPHTRWKGKPLLALTTVALGQGVLAFLGGWSAARGDVLSAINAEAILGILTATLLIVGLYPLTQSYQLDEDARRGDWTLARFLGVHGSFRWATTCIALGGAGVVWIVVARFSALEGLALMLFVGILLAWVRIWAASFEKSSVAENYRTLMRIYTATALPFIAWISFHLVNR
jgi:1,4-dihydroxy-2-naphthoate octaprenyltransferase